MKPVAFEYVEAKSVSHAVECLDASAGTAKIIAGGQSLGPMLNLRLARPALLVDIGRLPELKQVSSTDDRLVIGAGVTHAEIEDGILVGKEPGLLQAIASRIAYRAVRNRGTLGGSLSHADPAADWLLAMTALDAYVVVQGKNGVRRVPLGSFMITAFTTVLADDEVVAAVEPRLTSDATRWSHKKIARKVGKFADAAAVVILDRKSGFASVAIGRPDSAPSVFESLAVRLKSSHEPVAVGEVAENIDRVVGPQDDYDRHIQIAILKDALDEVIAQ
ncbi:FAD binding domain-containing protein [Rhizobium sp. VS19-DR104.2]|uniref:FAD binding domain-containing protein n=1 Tax=unclassified Rhizobium TaxID=2613769 RepID=UPI001CC65238|nr:MULTISPECIES: FAD binding domain-containing protein [unclassified Rhizobium]MBZ5762226.1 FAD binding domain-containing protein [Rhizobium sp. VS19-DR96]MBZ5768242.1 FAD binding domain-containing protein [Rhizobium sp. VS19-DR129.2]MBZ5775886.1 FAD binding domain-containing protein [Rhizobium sp. VS19-DRK62.2]MBZ5787093.1 FAD binding domain-containing protein [Rhizobium sp. VS19-DR121]MBZ5804167.1 FAD binding domain-containing protein [Rhizobium sp. VS19-DR181]